MTDDRRLSEIHEQVGELCEKFGALGANVENVCKRVEDHNKHIHGDGGSVVGLTTRLDRVEQDVSNAKKLTMAAATTISGLMTWAFQYLSGHKQG